MWKLEIAFPGSTPHFIGEFSPQWCPETSHVYHPPASPCYVLCRSTFVGVRASLLADGMKFNQRGCGCFLLKTRIHLICREKTKECFFQYINFFRRRRNGSSLCPLTSHWHRLSLPQVSHSSSHQASYFVDLLRIYMTTVTKRCF